MANLLPAEQATGTPSLRCSRHGNLYRYVNRASALRYRSLANYRHAPIPTPYAVRAALVSAQPGKVVCLSTIGAQASETNLLTQRTLMEQALCDLPMPVTFLRPGWFMENAEWDVTPARDKGMIPSFLQPLDKAFPMVATADVGRVAAQLLLQIWNDLRVVELEGPRRVSPLYIAGTFARILGHAVLTEGVARDTWEALFRSQGMKEPLPRMRMLDGFNEGWITFEGKDVEIVKGEVELETVLRTLVSQAD